MVHRWAPPLQASAALATKRPPPLRNLPPGPARCLPTPPCRRPARVPPDRLQARRPKAGETLPQMRGSFAPPPLSSVPAPALQAPDLSTHTHIMALRRAAGLVPRLLSQSAAEALAPLCSGGQQLVASTSSSSDGYDSLRALLRGGWAWEGDLGRPGRARAPLACRGTCTLKLSASEAWLRADATFGAPLATLGCSLCWGSPLARRLRHGGGDGERPAQQPVSLRQAGPEPLQCHHVRPHRSPAGFFAWGGAPVLAGSSCCCATGQPCPSHDRGRRTAQCRMTCACSCSSPAAAAAPS